MRSFDSSFILCLSLISCSGHDPSHPHSSNPIPSEPSSVPFNPNQPHFPFKHHNPFDPYDSFFNDDIPTGKDFEITVVKGDSPLEDDYTFSDGLNEDYSFNDGLKDYAFDNGLKKDYAFDDGLKNDYAFEDELTYMPFDTEDDLTLTTTLPFEESVKLTEHLLSLGKRSIKNTLPSYGTFFSPPYPIFSFFFRSEYYQLLDRIPETSI